MSVVSFAWRRRPPGRHVDLDADVGRGARRDGRRRRQRRRARRVEDRRRPGPGGGQRVAVGSVALVASRARCRSPTCPTLAPPVCVGRVDAHGVRRRDRRVVCGLPVVPKPPVGGRPDPVVDDRRDRRGQRGRDPHGEVQRDAAARRDGRGRSSVTCRRRTPCRRCRRRRTSCSPGIGSVDGDAGRGGVADVRDRDRVVDGAARADRLAGVGLGDDERRRGRRGSVMRVGAAAVGAGGEHAVGSASKSSCQTATFGHARARARCQRSPPLVVTNGPTSVPT